MVSCGYETPAVIDGFTTWKGFLALVKGNFNKYPDPHALKLLNEFSATTEAAKLVQIGQPSLSPEKAPEETVV
jgi:hypothetical protein